MKKTAIYMIMILFLITGCTVNKENISIEKEPVDIIENLFSPEYTSIKDLSKDYNIDQAIKDNALVITYSKIYNSSLYDSFIENIKNNKDAFLRIVQPTVEGDIIITDIKYENDKVVVITDNTRDRYSGEEDRKITIEAYEHIEERIEILETGGIRQLIVYNDKSKDDYRVILSLYAFID